MRFYAAGLSRARASQVMDLLNLAPEIQAQSLKAATSNLPSERHLRAFAGVAECPKQYRIDKS